MLDAESFLVGPGEPRYAISITADWFATTTVMVTLSLGQALDVPVKLALAGVSAEVSVTADAPVLETRRTQVSVTITPDEVDSLPLNGRNYLDLALLTPGVSRTVQRNTERFAETSAVPGTGISIAGQRNLNNNFIVDGLSANDDAAGLAGTYFAEEVIREFQVVTSGGISEFGRASAGIINIVTHAGSNRRHVRTYGFFRNDALDARNPLAAGKDPLSQAQYGATASGPIVRDRTFLFTNVERMRVARTGVITIADAVVARVNRVLDNVGYAGPRLATGEFATGHRASNAFGRVDHVFGAATRLAGRYSLYDVSSENARSVGGLNAVSRGTRLDNRDQTLAVNLLQPVSGVALNELRGQMTRSRLDAPANDPLGPAANISGVASFGSSTASPTGRALDLFQVSDSYTHQRGAHLLKLGGELLHQRVTVEFPGAVQGVYVFSNLANFEAGTYINFQQAFGQISQFQSNPNVALFAQDEWRARPSLTVNAGVRYDLQWLGGGIRTDTSNVSPRLGVAFTPGDGRTVVRASGGVYFDRIPLRAVSNALQRDGFRYRVALVTFGQPGAPAFPQTLSAFPATLLTNVTTIDPTIDAGSARQATLQVERQLGHAMSATVGFIHLTGRGIIMSRNINVPTLTAAQAAALGVANLGRPDARYGNNSQYQSIGRSRYNGLTLAFNANTSPLGTLRVSYTFSEAFDDAGNAFFSSPQDNFDVAADYGRSDNDQRHRFVASGSTRPVWGMQLAALFSYASAPPFNIQTGTDRNNDTAVNDRPAGVVRNTGIGFDSTTLDLRVSRTFTLRHGHRIEALVEAFNVLNRANLLIPNNIYGTGATPTATFGRATAAADPRQIQLGARWTF